MSNHQKLENNLNAPHWETDEESGAHYTVEHYSAVKRDELQMHVTMWKNGRFMTLGESSQT